MQDDDLSLIKRELGEIKRYLQQIRQLVGPFGLSMPDGSIITQTIHGQTYFIDAADEIMTPQMVMYRQWEADISATIRTVVTQDTTFVDVGANFGYFTCLAASRMGNRGKGRVYCFEPNPRLIALLRKNVGINWSSAPVIVSDCAVSEESGTAILTIPKNRGANASLSTTAVDPTLVEQLSVRSVRLDDVLPEDAIVDLMKVDVEGHEYSVLRGAARVIDRSPQIKIILEWSIGQMKAAGILPTLVRDYFEEKSMRPFRASASSILMPEQNLLEWDELLRTNYANILLFRHKS